MAISFVAGGFSERAAGASRRTEEPMAISLVTDRRRALGVGPPAEACGGGRG